MATLFFESVCGRLMFVTGRRVIGISGSLIWSENLMELIFNPCGEFHWSPNGRVSQIHSPHLHTGAPGIFSDLLRSVQILESGMQKAMGSYHTYLSLVKLQPWLLSLQWKTCLGQNCNLGSCIWSERPTLGQNTLMMMMMISVKQTTTEICFNILIK